MKGVVIVGARMENAHYLLEQIGRCRTEKDLEKVSDRAEEMVQIGLITKKAYRFIEEALDDRLSYLVQTGKI